MLRELIHQQLLYRGDIELVVHILLEDDTTDRVHLTIPRPLPGAHAQLWQRLARVLEEFGLEPPLHYIPQGDEGWQLQMVATTRRTTGTALVLIMPRDGHPIATAAPHDWPARHVRRVITARTRRAPEPLQANGERWGRDTPPVVYDGTHLVETSDRNTDQQGLSLVQTKAALRKSRRYGRQHEPATVGPTGNTSQREQHPAQRDSWDTSTYLELRPSLDLIYMLDTHVSVPNTVWNAGDSTPPNNPWTELPLWDGHCAEEYHIYTDGPSGVRGTGGAAVLFVKQRETWYWGGFILTNIPEQGAHMAEMAGLCTALLWVCHLGAQHQAAHRPAPEVHVHFDATAAGWKIQGRWGGRVHQENRMRHLITLSETRYHTRHHFHHVKGHSGQWGPGRLLRWVRSRHAEHGPLPMLVPYREPSRGDGLDLASGSRGVEGLPVRNGHATLHYSTHYARPRQGR